MRQLILLFMVGCALGCAASSPTSSILKPSKTAVLPVVDLRPEPGEGQAIAHLLHNRYIARQLQKKGYRIGFESDVGQVEQVKTAIFAKADPVWLRSLVPADARWILLVALRDVRRTGSLRSAFVAECAGLLFDRIYAKVVWRDSLTSHEVAGGDIQETSWQRGLAQGCFRRLLQTLPDRSGRRRVK